MKLRTAEDIGELRLDDRYYEETGDTTSESPMSYGEYCYLEGQKDLIKEAQKGFKAWATSNLGKDFAGRLIERTGDLTYTRNRTLSIDIFNRCWISALIYRESIKGPTANVHKVYHTSVVERLEAENKELKRLHEEQNQSINLLKEVHARLKDNKWEVGIVTEIEKFLKGMHK